MRKSCHLEDINQHFVRSEIVSFLKKGDVCIHHSSLKDMKVNA